MSVLAQRLQGFLVKEMQQGQGVGNGQPQGDSVAPPEQEPAQVEVGDTTEQADECEEKDAEEVADDRTRTKQGEQEEHEEVIDQVVQTEATCSGIAMLVE